jgi:hypothetical protein
MNFINFVKGALYISVTLLVSINLVRFLKADPIWILFSLVGVVVGVMWIIFAACRLYILIYEMVDDFRYG